MEYILHVTIMIGIYAILASSLNLMAGYAGLLSIAHAAFFGIGAYVTALMSIHLQTAFLTNIGAAILISSLIAALVGIPSLRVRDDYFVFASFALQIIFFDILNNWVSLTGGPMGLPGIPQPEIFGLEIKSSYAFLFLVFCICFLCIWIIKRIVQSPIGRVLKSIREDEIFTLCAGKNVPWFKILIFVISSGIASIAGVLYAYYVNFVDPTSFNVMESIFIISIMIIGGAGSLWGPIIGAILLIIIPEFFRFIGLPASEAANIRQILYGGILVLFMIWQPKGLLGEYAFQNREAQK